MAGITYNYTPKMASRSQLARNLSQQYGDMTVKLKQGETREMELLRKNKKLKEKLKQLAGELAALTEQLRDTHIKTGMRQQEVDELYLAKSRENSMRSEIALLKTQLEQRSRDQERWTTELAKLRALQARLVEEAGVSARQAEEYKERLHEASVRREDHSESALQMEKERRQSAEREVAKLRAQLRSMPPMPSSSSDGGVEAERLRKEVEYWKQKAVVALESGQMLHANRTSAEASLESTNAELQRKLRELQQSNDEWRRRLVEKLNLQLAVERKKLDGHVLRLKAQHAQQELQAVQGELSGEALPFDQLHIASVKPSEFHEIHAPVVPGDAHFLPSSSAAPPRVDAPPSSSRSPFTHPNGLLRDRRDELDFVHANSPSRTTGGLHNNYFTPSSAPPPSSFSVTAPSGRGGGRQPLPSRTSRVPSSSSGLRTPPRASQFQRDSHMMEYSSSSRSALGGGSGISPEGKRKLKQSHAIVHSLLGIRSELNQAEREQAELEARLQHLE